MLWQAFTALLSHWRKRPLQLAMLVLGLALATALWSAVQAINGEARASYARAAAVVGQDRFSTLARADGQRFSEEAYVALLSNEVAEVQVDCLHRLVAGLCSADGGLELLCRLPFAQNLLVSGRWTAGWLGV